MKQATHFGILNFPLKNETLKIFANILKRPISISLTTEWYQRIKSVKLNNKTWQRKPTTKMKLVVLPSVQRPCREAGRPGCKDRLFCTLYKPNRFSRRRRGGKRGGKEKGKKRRKGEEQQENAKKRKREREAEEHEITAVAGPFVTPRTSLAKGRPGSECIPRRPRTASLQFGPRRTQVTACTLR